MRDQQAIPTATLTDLLPAGGRARNVLIRNLDAENTIYCQVTGETDALDAANGMPIEAGETFSYQGRINEKAPVQVIHEAGQDVSVAYIFE